MKLSTHHIPLGVSLIALVGLIFAFQGYKTSNTESVHVTAVIDGDTIVIDTGERIRLIGVDAPEKNRCFYDESKEFLSNLITNQTLTLEKDEFNTDQYERKLRYAYLNGELINNTIIREGYALASFKENRRIYEPLLKSEKEAIDASRGLWAACEDYEYVPHDDPRVRRDNHSDPANNECVIKGNISKSGYGLVYSFPGCPSYSLVEVDTEKGDQYFCTEEEAQAAGFKRSGDCPY